MAGSSVDYVNRALVMLGAETITALTLEDSPNAATAVDLYDPTLEQLLSEWPWRFATGRVQLSQIDDVDPIDTAWTYQYALPAVTLRIVRTDVTNGRWMLYRDPESGYRRLYSDEASVWADIVQVPDAALFPPHFQTALVASLAAQLAMPVTRKWDIAQTFEARAQRAISSAKAHDWNEQPWPEMDDACLLLNARFGG